MIVGFVGIGLIGGSLAKASRGFKNAKIYGFDIDCDILKSALRDGTIDEGFNDIRNFNKCDLVIFSTPPKVTKSIINSCTFKKGAVVSDVCGVKSFINEIRQDIDFVGGHPMAGKEKGGYYNSEKNLFKSANYILIKRSNTSNHACEVMEEFTKYIGCGCVRWTDENTHDKMISFTSQMPHVLSAIIVQNASYDICQDFEGGSLNDFTRIACLDENMWSELFFENKENLLNILTFLQENIAKVESFLQNGDKHSMVQYLSQSRQRRIEHEKS